MARAVLAVLVVVVAVVAYVVLEPVPDDVGDSPWTVKLFSLQQSLRPYIKWWTPTGLDQWLDEMTRANYREGRPKVPYWEAVFDRVPVRIFAVEPAEGKTSKRPAIVYYHGGGFIHRNVDTYHPITAMLAKGLDAVVISVE
ncbi:uncharacterized protein LOC110985339 [Acanthaster planci]|uniref:Uncharacterized protein LOC110985339 n=1 Tax=Acanthaster planci TaxID=133434 RepID=A0A8B7Z8K6_ACAPL|nr:uncharacterized protein LOC110985339 [Acanthaster planci]